MVSTVLYPFCSANGFPAVGRFGVMVHYFERFVPGPCADLAAALLSIYLVVKEVNILKQKEAIHAQ